MKANTKLCSTQYSALKFSKFKYTLNKDRKNFQSSITSASVNHIQVQVQSKFKCDDLGIRCQCINDHYLLLV